MSGDVRGNDRNVSEGTQPEGLQENDGKGDTGENNQGNKQENGEPLSNNKLSTGESRPSGRGLHQERGETEQSETQGDRNGESDDRGRSKGMVSNG